jgi:hypothetical protein
MLKSTTKEFDAFVEKLTAVGVDVTVVDDSNIDFLQRMIGFHFKKDDVAIPNVC